MLTQKKNFEFLWSRLIDLVKEHTSLEDVSLMAKLGFSPPSWKIWKPKFIEKSNIIKIVVRDTKFEYKITYDRKSKSWFVESMKDYRERAGKLVYSLIFF